MKTNRRCRAFAAVLLSGDSVCSPRAGLIQDLNLKAGEVPFLAGETVHADQQGACAGFNKIMAELPKTLPNSHVISSAGCTCNPDHLHFNSAGSRELGKRYGEKMLSLMGVQVAKLK